MRPETKKWAIGASAAIIAVITFLMALNATPNPFTLKSTAFKDGAVIPAKHACDGDDVSPFLEIRNPPAGTATFALIVDDPDATRGTPFTHWLLWNIPGNTQYLAEDSIPQGAVQGMNDFGRIGWGGPCPPRGAAPHRYQFTIYALDTSLSLSPGGTKDELLALMEGHVLGKAVLTGLYARP